MSSDSPGLLEITDRAHEGPSCKTFDFETRVLPNRLAELVKEYDIGYDPDNPVPSENSLADDLFEAGLRLFLDVGILCLDSQRLIRFDESEVKTRLRNLVPELVVGAGRDARKVYRREIEDSRPPVVFGGPFGGPLSPRQPFVDAMTSMAKEPIISMISYGSLDSVEGRPVVLGSPLEIHAARCESRWMREAAARAGRPGMHLMGSSAQSAAAEIANSDPIMGYRSTDGRNTCLLSSLKIDYNQLNKVKHFLDYSTFIYTYYTDLIGGYTGGPETSAVAAIASNLGNMMINQASYQEICVAHIHTMSTTHRACVWAQNVAAQAIARNTKIITFQACMTSSGPCTDMILYETAVTALGVSAGANVLGVMSTGSRLRDRYTGLEQRFMGEVGHAAAGMKRENANELVKWVLPKYENQLRNPPLGKTFQECYDLEKLKPTEDWLSRYERIKEDLENLGLDFEHGYQGPGGFSREA